MDKLSELSKPVAWAFKDANDVEHASIIKKANLYGRHDFQPLYSQEYVSALLAELEAKDKRIAELERANTSQDDHINQQQDRIDSLEKTNTGLGRRLGDAEKRLATPVRLLGEMLVHDWEHRVDRQAAFEHRKIAWDARMAEDKKAILAAGFTFTVEGDEQS
ncbi:hypothetical protein I5Q20_03520 [Serratia marcescens]|nr:hypothetical protein [Serratia marcescens]